jgi:hypothetical protein
MDALSLFLFPIYEAKALSKFRLYASKNLSTILSKKHVAMPHDAACLSSFVRCLTTRPTTMATTSATRTRIQRTSLIGYLPSVLM